jgi:hypothetical protein
LFNFFKPNRVVPIPETPTEQGQSNTRPERRLYHRGGFPAPIPVPEATDADWSEWENSVAFQDSQIFESAPTQPAELMAQEIALNEDNLGGAFDGVFRNSP